MSKTIGIDIGYGHTKATDGKKTYIFPTVVADSVDLDFKIQRTDNDVSNLHAIIDNHDIFVGSLAIKQGDNPLRFKSKDRVEDAFAKEVFLTTLGLFCDFDNTNDVIEDSFQIVSGLPVGDLARYKQLFMDKYIGIHEFELYGRKLKIKIDRIQIVPQPFGTWCNKYFLDNGGCDRDFSELHVGIVDVGYRTSDFIQVSGTSYISKFAKTSDHGVSDVFYKLEEYLNKRYGIKKEDYELEQIINKREIYIRSKGYIDLSKVIEEFERNLAIKLAKQIKSYWDNIDSLEGIFITGGGGKMLYDYLGEILGKDIEVMNSPQISNCVGYYKWARSVFGQRTI